MGRGQRRRDVEPWPFRAAQCAILSCGRGVSGPPNADAASDDGQRLARRGTMQRLTTDEARRAAILPSYRSR
jgi:hypothetical protein